MAKCKIGDVAKVVSERVDNPSKSQYDRFVGLEHYISGDVEIKKYGKTDMLQSAMKVFKADDVLIARRNVYLKRASVVKFDGITSGDSIVLRIQDTLIRRLLPFILNTDDFWSYAEKYADGTMSKRLSPEVLLQYEFDLPSIKDQERLAELLWAGNETKEAYKKLSSMTDDLVKSQFIEMFGDPVINPKGWMQSTIENSCIKILGGGTPSKDHTEYYTGNIPWVTPKDMKSLEISDSIDHLTEEAIVNSSTNIVPANAILMVIRSGILKHSLPVAITKVDVCINQDMKAFITKNMLNPIYLLYYFKVVEADVLSGVRAVTADNIEFSQLKNRLITLPPLGLQNQFAGFVQQTDKSKFELQQTITSLENTMKSLMLQHIG